MSTVLAQAVATIVSGTASTETAAEVLGVAPVSIRSMIHRGQLEALRIGREVRVLNSELARVVEARNQKVLTVAEVSA